MNFSQPNKINSCPPRTQATNSNCFQQSHQNPQSNTLSSYQSSHQQNSQSNSFQSYASPLQQQRISPAPAPAYTYQYDQSCNLDFNEPDRSQQQFVAPHYSGGDLIQDTTKSYYQSQQPMQQLQPIQQLQPMANMPMMNYDSMRPLKQRNVVQRSVCQQPMMEDAKPYYLSPQDYEDTEEEAGDESNVKVTYFQSPPARSAAPIRSERLSNPFKTIIEPLTRPNRSIHRSVQTRVPRNHQTFVYKYENDDEDEVVDNSPQKSFKSQTKICKIPNGGVRIVTDIFRDDNQPSADLSKSTSISGEAASSHANMNEWMGKSIEVTVTAADGSEVFANYHRNIDDEDANDVREDR